MDLMRLKDEQHKLSRRIVLKDELPKIRTIAGCDIAYTNDKIIAAIVVVDAATLKVREVQHTVDKGRFPYISGFLAYREAPITIETYHKLELEPDLLIVDGNGILHPRRMGLACHIGLALDKPCIGVAKSLLCGEQNGDTIYLGKDVVGKVLETKKKAKPIYVSPGHKITLQTAFELIRGMMREHKLPEPLHEAHKHAAKMRRKIREEHCSFINENNHDEGVPA